MTGMMSRIGWVLAVLALLAVGSCEGSDGSEPEAGAYGEAGALVEALTIADVAAAGTVGVPAALRANRAEVPDGARALDGDPDDDECCTDPGQANECWSQDAEDDGVTCEINADCPSNSCDTGSGLCECLSDDDCNEGVCTEEGVCGPSWCNGYRVCSCWGGCEWWHANESYTPDDWATGLGMYCCEGIYPYQLSDPDTPISGYISDDPTCGMGCLEDSDCNDNNPCTIDQCTDNAGLCEQDNGCTYTLLDGLACDFGSGLTDTQSLNCTQQVCRGETNASNCLLLDTVECVVEPINLGANCLDNPQGVDAGWWGDAPRPLVGPDSCYYQQCDTDGECTADASLADGMVCSDLDYFTDQPYTGLNTCTDELCLSGVCDHDPTAHVGQVCNNDNDACTSDACQADGTCLEGAAADCDDSNWCTYPDECVDTDPMHLLFMCVNPPVNGNAESYGYVDTEDCEDLICDFGFEDPTPTECDAYNPYGYDLQCNAYACVDGNGEDNCTLDYTSFLGASCSDGDACTLGDICVDAGGYGECQSGSPMVCDDGNPCTSDACSGGSCVYTPLTGPLCDADGDLCTVDDYCNAGVCTPGDPVDCTPLWDECNYAECNPLNGNCEYDNTAIIGDACDSDSDLCTHEYCDGTLAIDQALSCTYDSTEDCSAWTDQCNVGECDAGTGNCYADPVTNGTLCDADSNLCTQNDNCQDGACVPGPLVDCSAFNDQCNSSTCDTGTGNCEYNNSALLGIPCNLDSNGCTHEECDGPPLGDSVYSCVNVGAEDCADGNVCTDDVCNSTGIYSFSCTNPPEPATTSCEADNNGCTVDDHCNGSGTCIPGPPVSPNQCESTLGVNTDCATAHCDSLGPDSYQCIADALDPLPGPGSCNVDNNGCTLDYCQASADPAVGAFCVGGGPADCTGLDNLPCQWGTCVQVDSYDYNCEEAYAVSTVLCNADSNGCSINDHCNGSGGCAPGNPAVCTPTDICNDSTCQSTGINSYTCQETALPNCCTDVSDCLGLGLPCEGATPPPAGCTQLACVANECVCQNAPDGNACTDYDLATYPENCYDAFCQTGVCTPAVHPAYNNLCSDAFQDGNPNLIDTAADSYLGAIPNTAGDGYTLSAGGSTLCAENNYFATGDQCIEDDGVTDIGTGGRDLVYVFRYQTNSAAQFVLYSYVIKVEADYDVGIYIATDIDSATDCPEGNNPDADLTTYVGEDSERCNFPFDDGSLPDPPPAVVEDECNESGNTFFGQECCDPCVDGFSCGYKWCERGYPNGCDFDCNPSDCIGEWVYPDDPYDCSSVTPPDPEYDTYTNMAEAVISPKGSTDGTWRTVFVYVDGVGGDVGNFYLTVEKVRWWASPCDRVNDDPRVYDVTHPDPGGSTYIGTLEGVVNSMHSFSGICGGYDCGNASWSGNTLCHGVGAANQFWPNTETFKIHRSTSEGASTYCIMTDEAVTDAADLVLQAWRRANAGAISICDESYWDEGCVRNNSGNNIKRQFNAAAGELYLLALSQYAWSNRPCDPGLADDCNYKITVIEGICPVVCNPPLKPVAGPAININDPAWGTVTRNGTISAASGDHYYINASDTYDHVYALYNNTSVNVNVTFTLCGTWDAMIGLYNCSPSLITSRDLYGSGTCESFTYSVAPSADPYYVTADSWGATALGAYTLTVQWGSPPVVCSLPSAWSTPYTGPVLSSGITFNGSTFTPATSVSGNTTGSLNYDAYGLGRDHLWSLAVSSAGTGTFSTCGAAAFDTMLRVYNCAGTAVVSNDDACGLQSQLSATLSPSNAPYYILLDGYGSTSNGAYTVNMW